MIGDVQQRLVKVRNELAAQKVISELAYASILWPENTPTATWSGSLALQITDGVVARFQVRFKRNDGNFGAPYVDFAQTVSFTPTFPDYVISQGVSISGNDLNYVDDQNYTGYVAGTGDDYVDYYIDFLADLLSNYDTLASVDVSITAEAICMIKGTLTITRLI